MRRFLLLLLILLLVIAYVTKPDDKTCIVEGVKAVWGTRVPGIAGQPFEHFMDVTSQDVKVKDWVFFKQVKYKLNNAEKTVAYGAFKKIYPVVKPMEEKPFIPRIPASK